MQGSVRSRTLSVMKSSWYISFDSICRFLQRTYDRPGRKRNEKGRVTGLLNDLSRNGLSQRFDHHEDKRTEHLNETRSQAAKWWFRSSFGPTCIIRTALGIHNFSPSSLNVFGWRDLQNCEDTRTSRQQCIKDIKKRNSTLDIEAGRNKFP